MNIYHFIIALFITQMYVLFSLFCNILQFIINIMIVLIWCVEDLLKIDGIPQNYGERYVHIRRNNLLSYTFKRIKKKLAMV